MKALITGITGQDGSYLAELLLSMGYEIHGLVRPTGIPVGTIDHTNKYRSGEEVRLHLHCGDLSDSGRITSLIYNIQPDEIYHLGAQSHENASFDTPEYTGDITGLGSTRLLEAVRQSGIKTRFYQASSSSLFGSSPPPQGERTPFCPRSPYGIAKLYSHWMVASYRESYNMFACNGILFDHESPRSSEHSLARTITRGLANILAGSQKEIYIGKLDARRDWGFAPEYVEVMWRMLQQDRPDDYVIGTGESHSIREFINTAFGYAGIELEWTGSDLNEVGVVRSSRNDSLYLVSEREMFESSRMPSEFIPGQVLVEVDPHCLRPTKFDVLRANIAKAKRQLDWWPRLKFFELVRLLVDYDLKLVNIASPGEKVSAYSDRVFGHNGHGFSPSDGLQEVSHV